MRKIAFFLLLMITGYCFSQNNREIIPSPNIRVNNLKQDETPVKVSEVKTDVKIVGSLAVTTIEMSFYNPNNRVLEGELNFPLAEGQTIFRFALDINGKLREGVVVEKAKGQAVFESTIRKNIDPGLLEKTQGNNFRTRVYPLPAKGYRTILIAYEQELSRDNDNYRFFLPVEYGDKLNFNLTISVFGSDNTPKMDKTPWGNFKFDKAGDAYLASYSAKDYSAQGQLIFSIPVKDNRKLFVEKGKISNETVFYSQIFPEIVNKTKQLPSRIALYWDASSSMEKRNFKLEAELLSAYFKEINNVTIDLYTFNCILKKNNSFSIKNGNWSELKLVLENMAYDGGTQLGTLNLNATKADEILLFTDGLSNFGKITPETGTIPVSTISSTLSTNHTLLKFITSSTGGKFINLMQETPQESVNMLKNESYRLISADYNKSDISDFTTSGTVIKAISGFSMAGKLNVAETTITLNFGIGNEVLHSEKVVIRAKDAVDYDNIVERVWAEKRITELDQLYDQNKDEIESLGRKYNIVTRNTSLIVLDRVEDYIQHQITPPAELMEEYNRQLDEINTEKENERESRIDDILSSFEERKEWWNLKFPKTPPAKKTKPKKRDEAVIFENHTEAGVFIDDYAPEAISVAEAAPAGDRSYNRNYTEESNKSTESFADKWVASSSDLQKDIASPEEALAGKLAGVVVPVAPQNAETRIRGNASSESSGAPLYIVDGLPVNDISSISPDDIHNIEVLKDASAKALYGSKGANGVVIVTTKGAASNKTNEEFQSLLADIALKDWSPDTPYLKELKSKSNEELYKAYLNIRNQYKTMPSFFLDVAAFFEERGLKEEALVILSNLAEMEIEDYQLYRVLAHRLKQLNYTDYAIDVFKTVLQLRPEEPQSYRDLGLAYAQNKEYQDAINTMYKIVEQEWDGRFPGIEVIAIEEINAIITKAKQENINLKLNNIDKRLIFNMPVDIRIVLNWDTDNSDMDLWVTDPYGEQCDYSNNLTRIGGMISDDFTDGYGPEEFLIKQAVPGKYQIQANYYGSREQTLIGPTTIYLDIFTRYGSGREEKKTITLRLTEDKEVIDIGEISFK